MWVQLLVAWQSSPGLELLKHPEEGILQVAPSPQAGEMQAQGDAEDVSPEDGWEAMVVLSAPGDTPRPFLPHLAGICRDEHVALGNTQAPSRCCGNDTLARAGIEVPLPRLAARVTAEDSGSRGS